MPLKLILLATIAISIAYGVYPAFGALAAAALAFTITFFSPPLGLPLLLFGVLIRPVESGLPLQDGWFIILAVLAAVIANIAVNIAKAPNNPVRADHILLALTALSALAAIFGILQQGNITRHVAATALPLLTALYIGSLKKNYKTPSLHTPPLGDRLLISLPFFYATWALLIVALKGHGLDHGIGGALSLRVAEISPRSVSVPLGALLLLSFGVLLEGQLHSDKRRRIPLYYWLLPLFGLGALILTGSRIAIIAFFVAFVFIVFRYLFGEKLSRLHVKRSVKVAFSVLTTALLGYFATQHFSLTDINLRATIPLDLEGSDGRLFRWSVYLEKTPVSAYLVGLPIPIWREWIGGHPHSFYISALFYYGVAGPLLIFAALVRFSYNALTIYRVTPVSLVLYSLIVFLTSGFPDRPDFWMVLIITALSLFFFEHHLQQQKTPNR